MWLKKTAKFLRFIGTGRIDEVRGILAAAPDMATPSVRIRVMSKSMSAGLAGADVNGVNDQYDHWSPLMVAIGEGREAMRDELIRRGARIGLTEALLLGDDARVGQLLRPGAEALPALVPNAGSLLNFARTPFAIDRLIDPRRRPIGRGHNGCRRLSALRGHKMAARARRERQRRSNEKSRHTALHSAAWNGDLEMVKLLVGAGADLAALDEEHHGTPLAWADVSIDVTNNPACRAVVEYLTTHGSSD